MEWESLLPSLPESPCNSQNAWEDRGRGKSLCISTLWVVSVWPSDSLPYAILTVQMKKGMRRPCCSS